ncbi:MAG: FkbM family methyltransferase [Phenylobacterium sp.]|uniref:FkbM family methyltransferase n=1 Tax=Phenylobacterium sp. TaxID=1871053 RepID=UPI0027339A6E|nr:FkbM family methyltransferase [Phenylobacterium sp.]MDP3174252.1 FkbM family methyltransferase [Phenylobacterium sp.]
MIDVDVASALGLGDVGVTSTPAGPIFFARQGSGWRYDTLLTKEPETIEWIDGFEPGETLWDIGANVGVYSLYAAKRGLRVLAFEPHFANYFHLCANIMLNGLQDQITAYCLAFAQEPAASTINLADVSFGHSMSSFGSDLDFRGRPYEVAFRQGMIGYDIDGFCRDLGVAVPDHVKIDVDGIELDIVRGGRVVLADTRVKSVSIELIETDAAQVSGVDEVLGAAGLTFIHKKQNPEFRDTPTGDVLNFLYRRG